MTSFILGRERAGVSLHQAYLDHCLNWRRKVGIISSSLPPLPSLPQIQQQQDQKTPVRTSRTRESTLCNPCANQGYIANRSGVQIKTKPLSVGRTILRLYKRTGDYDCRHCRKSLRYSQVIVVVDAKLAKAPWRKYIYHIECAKKEKLVRKIGNNKKK